MDKVEFGPSKHDQLQAIWLEFYKIRNVFCWLFSLRLV